jgi:hypothetical protein
MLSRQVSLVIELVQARCCTSSTIVMNQVNETSHLRKNASAAHVWLSNLTRITVSIYQSFDRQMHTVRVCPNLAGWTSVWFDVACSAAGTVIVQHRIAKGCEWIYQHLEFKTRLQFFGFELAQHLGYGYLHILHFILLAVTLRHARRAKAMGTEHRRVGRMPIIINRKTSCGVR